MVGSIVDTNVITKMLNGDMAAVELLKSVDKAIVTPTIVGELYYGAEKSARKQQNYDIFNATLSHMDFLPITKRTASSYAVLKAELVSCGFNLPENDIWIAAVAHEHDIPVATFDSHFTSIKQIKVLS
jgi:tRNA(fMet)-specific endonuclease VapC